MLSPQAITYAQHLRGVFPPEVIDAVLASDTDYTRYQDDPVGFARDILGIDFTPDVSRLAESVRDHRVTVARSATGTGKSHGAAALKNKKVVQELYKRP